MGEIQLVGYCQGYKIALYWDYYNDLLQNCAKWEIDRIVTKVLKLRELFIIPQK